MKSILLLGSSCVGKTSVFDLLKEDPFLKDKYEFVSSLSRQIRRQSDREISFDDLLFQQELFDLYEEVLERSIDKPIIADRSILDVFTFTETFENNSMDLMVLLSNMVDSVHANREVLNNCLIFYFPIYWKVEDDHERLVDEKRRSLWDKYIQEILKKEGINSITVPCCSVRERVTFIRQFL